ncbi:MAG: B12-binding domain-containing radical SAM protein, partial [Firmicutes bacterium]|nr:B12-binding domain-containing radical SAM protein [Bacillota bacterium]
MALLFPDLYEIGMSHLGMRILYEVVNKWPEYLLERVFAPATDMEKLMRENHIPLFSWDNYHAVRDFDIVGVTLQYEMSFSNILNMLDLAGLPLLAADRAGDGWQWPLVVAGGPCASNPEPLA